MALPFARSSDFALDKPAGTPCRNLRTDDRCGIHAHLRDRGFAGCTVFDCLGAGQHVTQVTFGGASWRDGPDVAGPMFAVFPVVRRLHELRWYLADVLGRPGAAAVHDDVRALLESTRRLGDLPPDELRALDVDAHQRAVDAVLQEASRLVRSGLRGPDRRRADLVGASLGGADLRGADLRGALLLGADLRRADLRLADLVGADLRGADLSGADLSDALFVTSPQVAAARGDATTRLPADVEHPAHWLPARR